MKRVKLNVLYGNFCSKRKRLGRGIGSGKGKTSGRGIKGQKSRSGVSINSFEGGQQSIITALPKRGFNKLVSKKKVQCLNIHDIQKLYILGKIAKNQIINSALLFSLGVIRSASLKIKILGEGSISIALKFDIHSISSGALSSIEEVGGSIQV